NAFLGEMGLAHPDDYAYVVAQYDGEISQVDAQIGRLIGGMRELGVWDDTLFVLLSDHGECFGEGGLHFDHHGLYDAVTHIAMLMRIPGQGAQRVDALVSHEDVLPTICELAGIAPPEYPLTGRSLTPTLTGSDVRSEVVSVECSRQASLAWRTGSEKLIRPVTENAAGTPFPDWAGRKRCPDPLLFEPATDPFEAHDLAAERPSRVKELSAELESWRQDILAGRPDPILAQDGLSLPYEHFLKRVHKRKK
ncbi:MAG TPA: sulfatase-like hydrolase/transferase, partial [Mycobacteriales bacterium]|nr:sulfatase-like hydrolase/transferase [Mycobacteriales bacterium]